MDIPSNIKSIRQSKGVSQAELARRIDLDPSTYHRLENRGNKLTIEQATRIAEALGVSLIELLTWGEEKAGQEPIMDENQKLKDDLIQLQREKIDHYNTSLAQTIVKVAWLEFEAKGRKTGQVEYVENTSLEQAYIKFNDEEWIGYLRQFSVSSPFVHTLKSYGISIREEELGRATNSLNLSERTQMDYLRERAMRLKEALLMLG